MITQRFYLYERWISELYDNAVELDELEKIYNTFCFTSDSYLNCLNYALRCKKRFELISLIYSNHNKLRILFLKKVKVINNVTI